MLIPKTNNRHLIWQIIVVFCMTTFIQKCFIVANNVHLKRNAVLNASKLNAKPYSFYNEQIEMITDYFEVPKKVNRNNVSGSSSTSSSNTSSNRNQNNMLITKNKCRNCQTKVTTQSQTTWYWSTRLRNEVWSLPVLVFALLVMFLIGCFEVFVVFKAWSTTPSRRHLFLGQMLLLGLFLCAGIGAILSIQPTVATCALVRFGVGVSYALVFASLLVKCVFLISLNGGVYLPAPYQALLLFFAVLMQLAIATQWLLHTPPVLDLFTLDEVVSSHRRSFISTTPTSLTPSQISSSDSTHFADTITLCRSSFIDMIFSLVYVIFLLIFVAFLAVKSRHIRDNYREAVFICLSVFISGFVWFSWIVIGILINERHKDACLAFGLIFTAISIFLFMFMPKGRQLAALGKDGVYLEDRADDRFSSSSRGAYSGYSPSFFHFKPMSCDFDTPATCHNYKHHHQPTVTAFANGPDRLVSYPAPPSYKKFFQYYPNSISQYYYPPRLSSGVFVRPDDGNFYTTLEPTLSTNPNVYFHPRKGFHSGLIY